MSFIGIGINLWQPNENFAPGWVLNAGGKPATLDIDFVNNRAFLSPNSIQTPASLLTCTRASSGYYQDASGILSNVSSNNVLRTGTNGLLVEEARTNLALQSNTFGTTWVPTGITNLTTTTVGPDNVAASATLLNETAANSSHSILQSITKAASALTYTFSVYAKVGVGRTRLCMQIQDGSGNGAQVTYDLAGVQFGVVVGGVGVAFTAISGTIVQLGTTGWCFCTLTATSNTATSIVPILLDDAGSGTGAGNNSYAGTVGNGVYIFGAQLEQAAFATSYIPTTTTTATRSVDNINTNSITWFNQTTGSMYGQCSLIGVSATAQSIWTPNIDGNNFALLFGNNGSTPPVPGFEYQTAGVDQALLPNAAVTLGATNKTAGVYAVNDFASCTNGGTVATDASGALFTATNVLVGLRNGTSFPLNGYLKRMAYWNTRLTNTQLQTLTT